MNLSCLNQWRCNQHLFPRGQLGRVSVLSALAPPAALTPAHGWGLHSPCCVSGPHVVTLRNSSSGSTFYLFFKHSCNTDLGAAAVGTRAALLPWSLSSASCRIQSGAWCAFSRWSEEKCRCEQLAYVVAGQGSGPQGL